jgi:hypothetical protein
MPAKRPGNNPVPNKIDPIALIQISKVLRTTSPNEA